MGVLRHTVTGQEGGTIGTRWRPAVAGVSLVAAGLAVGGCGSSSNSSSSAPACFSKAAAAAQAGAAGGAVSPAAPGGAATAGGPANPAVAAGWTLPGGNLQNTRDVASAITSSNVSKLGVAWTVPIESTAYAAGYATTPVVVNGVVYTQDLESNVMAIELATGKVLWRHTYSSPNGGPDGVNVVNGTVYAATNHAAVALSAATGRQLWSRTLIGNDHEGIDMAPGYNHGTVYVSTVPVNPTVGEYLGGAKGDPVGAERQDRRAGVELGRGAEPVGQPRHQLRRRPVGSAVVRRPGQPLPRRGQPRPAAGGARGYPWGTSRPGPDLYTDSVVKLSPQGKLLWYYQLTPHDLFDWDLQNSPVLTTAHGQPVVIDGGKAGILIELNAQTGKLLWKPPGRRAQRP